MTEHYGVSEDYALSVEDLEKIAIKHGILQKGKAISKEMLAYTCDIIETCASLGDHYQEGESNAGEEIRAHFGIS